MNVRFITEKVYGQENFEKRINNPPSNYELYAWQYIPRTNFEENEHYLIILQAIDW